MKNSKLRKVLLLACSAVLLVCLSVGATLAYLTSTETVTNTFTVGQVKITLDEARALPNGRPAVAVKNDAGEIISTEEVADVSLADRVDSNVYHLMPGRTYTKDPTVTVKANSEDCYIRIRMTITGYDKLCQAVEKCNTRRIASGKDPLDLEDLISLAPTTVWDRKSSWADPSEHAPEYEYWYVYDAAEDAENPYLYPATTVDKKLPALFNDITIPDDFTNEEIALLNEMNITIVAEAIQADGFDDADDAWNHFN
ncbi:MAG: SipW-dependent-type signal peptide-containing protein [Aristaeellaceae bacterium]